MSEMDQKTKDAIRAHAIATMLRDRAECLARRQNIGASVGVEIRDGFADQIAELAEIVARMAEARE